MVGSKGGTACEVTHLEAEKIAFETMIALFKRREARHPAVTTINVVIGNVTVGEQRPDGAGHLVGKRHPDQHWWLAAQHPLEP